MKVTHLIFKYLFLFTLLLGIVGCEKEETNQPEINQTTNSGKSSMTRVDVKDIPSLDQFVQSKMSGFQKSEFNAMSSIVTPLGIVPLEDVLQVIDGQGNTNYSFRIVPEDLTSLSVYNLIIHQGPDGEEPIAYIMEYIREYDDNGNFNPYAKIRKYPYELIQKSISAKVGCGDADTYNDPCLELVLDTSESDTSTNNNASSGGGGGYNDGIIASPVGPITESTTNVVITISGDLGGDLGGTTSGHPDTQTNSPRGCAVVDQVFYDENGNIRVTTIWVDECPYNTDDKSSDTINIGKMSGCSKGRGDVAIDLRGLTLNDLNLLSSTLGLNSVLWLNQNCELDSLVHQMFTRTQKTTADAQLMASLVNFWRATEGNQDAFILSLDIINSKERGLISANDGIEMFSLLHLNNFSTPSMHASSITLKLLNEDMLNGPFDDAYYQALNGLFEYDTTDPYFGIRMSMQYALVKADHPDWPEWKILWEVTREMVHLGLDIIGLVPVVGEAADLANGAIYLLEGDMENAILSAAATIPFAGWAATGSKLVVKVVTTTAGEKALKIIASTSEGVAKIGKILDEAIPFLNNSTDINKFSDEIIEINKRFSDGGLLNGTPASAINTALYQNNILEQGASIFKSIARNHMFNNGNKRTAVEMFKSFARQSNIPINMNNSELLELATKVATGVLDDVTEIGVLLTK